MTGDKERRQAAIAALTGHQQQVLLAWLCGYVPHVIDEALGELFGAGQPAAQAAEGTSD